MLGEIVERHESLLFDWELHLKRPGRGILFCILFHKSEDATEELRRNSARYQYVDKTRIGDKREIRFDRKVSILVFAFNGMVPDYRTSDLHAPLALVMPNQRIDCILWFDGTLNIILHCSASHGLERRPKFVQQFLNLIGHQLRDDTVSPNSPTVGLESPMPKRVLNIILPSPRSRGDRSCILLGRQTSLCVPFWERVMPRRNQKHR